MNTPSPAALHALQALLTQASGSVEDTARLLDAAFDGQTVAALQQRLIERTEQSMATALRDAETIRQLREEIAVLERSVFTP